MQVTRDWVESDAPLNTPLSRRGELERVSAGTIHHPQTPHTAYSEVFDFIVERFKDKRAGNLRSS